MSIHITTLITVKHVNALTLRQSLGRVLDDLDTEGPILIEKGRRPRAVLISLKDYEERFVDHEALEARRALADSILALRDRSTPTTSTVVEDLRALRGPLS
jgi:PHD/YefM family antitoxin component YafN of YafNO toxin-antitoxin module